MNYHINVNVGSKLSSDEKKIIECLRKSKDESSTPIGDSSKGNIDLEPMKPGHVNTVIIDLANEISYEIAKEILRKGIAENNNLEDIEFDVNVSWGH